MLANISFSSHIWNITVSHHCVQVPSKQTQLFMFGNTTVTWLDHRLPTWMLFINCHWWFVLCKHVSLPAFRVRSDEESQSTGLKPPLMLCEMWHFDDSLFFIVSLSRQIRGVNPWRLRKRCPRPASWQWTNITSSITTKAASTWGKCRHWVRVSFSLVRPWFAIDSKASLQQQSVAWLIVWCVVFFFIIIIVKRHIPN